MSVDRRSWTPPVYSLTEDDFRPRSIRRLAIFAIYLCGLNLCYMVRRKDELGKLPEDVRRSLTLFRDGFRTARDATQFLLSLAPVGRAVVRR